MSNNPTIRVTHLADAADELAAHLRSEVQKWGRVIKERGMRAE